MSIIIRQIIDEHIDEESAMPPVGSGATKAIKMIAYTIRP